MQIGTVSRASNIITQMVNTVIVWSLAWGNALFLNLIIEEICCVLGLCKKCGLYYE